MADGKFNRYKRDDSERSAIFEFSDRHGIRAAAEKFNLSVHQIKGVRRHFRVRADRARRDQGVTLEVYRLRCLKYGYSKGLHNQEVDDFASYAVLQMLERGLRNAEWAFSEYNRQKFGRNGHKTEDTTDEPITEAQEPDNLIEFPKTPDGMLACLVFKWGFSQNELARMMGVSEAYVSLKIKPILEQMRNKYKVDD